MVSFKDKMAVEDVAVKVCMQEIVKLDLQVKALIQDIRDCKGPMEVLHDLNQDIRETIQELKGRLEELENLAKEQDKEEDKQALLKDVENHRNQLSITQASIRKSYLACQMAIERREKESLLEGGSDVRLRQKSSKENLAKAAGGITEDLMRISRMLSSNVTHSEQTMGTLVTSSKQVAETHEEFKSMSGHIQNSRKLLTKYGRRECTDKLLIFLALVFFFATVLYIVKKRVFSSAVE